MICPYCAEDVPAGSHQHKTCKRANDKPFPPLYLDHHAGAGQTEPIVVSVIGFSGHGKTIFLCALFDYLDDQLIYVWRNKFHKLVLDQESLSQLNDHRNMLRRGELPPPTELDFPRPGIFRLKHMPSTSGDLVLPPLVDTTILIYDPPGEAFRTESKIVDYASFVNRSNCVLFLIDLTALGTSIAQGMAELLETYVLGMRRMGIRQQSQDLIVVFTKSDELKISVPEFASLLEREPWLKDYLEEQRPKTLADPREHFKQLEKVSNVLAEFTWSDLKAANFVNIADDWFAGISYTAVSSLGSAPEFQEVEVQDDDEAEAESEEDADDSPDSNSEKVSVIKRLTTEMSPRGMADPLFYVLAKSLSRRPQSSPPVHASSNTNNGWFKSLLAKFPSWVVPVFALGAGTLAIAVVLAIVLLLAMLSWAWPVSTTVSTTKQNISANKAPNAVEQGGPSSIDRSNRGNSICA